MVTKSKIFVSTLFLLVILTIMWAVISKPTPHDMRLLALEELKKSNLNYQGFPLSQEQAKRLNGKLKSWGDYPVPVYVHNAPFVIPILQRYEAFTSRIMFNIKVVETEKVSNIKKGIIITQGTAYQPRDPDNSDMTPIPSIGTTSGEMGGWRYPNGFPLNNEGKIDGVIYINLAEYEVLKDKYGEYVSLPVMHEIGHALGLFKHVRGFNGNGSKPVDLEMMGYYTGMLMEPPGTEDDKFIELIKLMNY